jgi:hypothetical protein
MFVDRLEVTQTELKFKNSQIKDLQVNIETHKNCLKFMSNEIMKNLEVVCNNYNKLNEYVSRSTYEMGKKVKKCLQIFLKII